MAKVSYETLLELHKDVATYPTKSLIAEKLDISTRSLRRLYASFRAEGKDFSDRTEMKQKKAQDDSFLVKSRSTLTDADGNVKMQWTKESLDLAQYHANVKQAVMEMMEEFEGSYQTITTPTTETDDITTFYPLPDLHFGMLASKDESNHGYNYDLKIAERWVMGAMQYLVDSAPKSKYAVITDLGDFLHAADNSNRTKSGHQLDSDGRHYKIVKTSFAVTRNLIEEALKKHETVYFYSVGGNHSDNSGIYLKAYLDAWFRNEPRVIISNDDNKAQQYHRFGKNILGFTHGHELRPERCPEVMVFDNQDIFSETKYRYFHFGHFHNNKKYETPLCNIEIHKNIIPRDAWAEGMGFRGNIGEAKCISYHKEYGEIGRNTFNISMIGE